MCVLYYTIQYHAIPYHAMSHAPWSMVHPSYSIHIPIEFLFSLDYEIPPNTFHTHREILLCSSSPTPLQHTHTHTIFIFFPAIFFPFFPLGFPALIWSNSFIPTLIPVVLYSCILCDLASPPCHLVVTHVIHPYPAPHFFPYLPTLLLPHLLFRRTLQFRPTQPPTHFVRNLLRKELVMCCYHGPSFLDGSVGSVCVARAWFFDAAAFFSFWGV